MATWSTRANQDMTDLATHESPAAVNSIRATISQWANGVGAQRQRREFQGQLRFPVYAEAQNAVILLVEHD